MRPEPSFVIALLSFFSTSLATDQPDAKVLRVPLQRKSFISHPPPGPVPDVATGKVGYVDENFLKTHVNHVATKYRTAFAAYESNTGSPHPLAPLVSAIVSGAGTNLLAGTLEKRKRREIANRALLGRSRLAKRDDISLSEKNSNMWIGAISVGTPQQEFSVDFDTGSSDLVLPARACDSTCNGHTRYDSTASSTSINLNQTFQLAYRGGAGVNGTQYADNVYMGGYEAVNQTFGSATTYSSAMQSPTFLADGLLGLGFQPISVMNTPSVFQTMVSNGVVKQGVFGLALSSEAGKSELTIGGTNTNLYQESTTEYVSVSLPAFWQIPFAGLSRPSLNGTPDVAVVTKKSYAQAFIDSGTNLIVTSDSNAEAYYANITGAKLSASIGGGVWTVPCDIIDSIAPTLTFGSRNFTVSPSTFNLGPVSDGSSDCATGLAGGGGAYWIIGDVFLQNTYTIFDVSNTRIGFADLV